MGDELAEPVARRRRALAVGLVRARRPRVDDEVAGGLVGGSDALAECKGRAEIAKLTFAIPSSKNEAYRKNNKNDPKTGSGRVIA